MLLFVLFPKELRDNERASSRSTKGTLLRAFAETRAASRSNQRELLINQKIKTICGFF